MSSTPPLEVCQQVHQSPVRLTRWLGRSGEFADRDAKGLGEVGLDRPSSARQRRMTSAMSMPRWSEWLTWGVGGGDDGTRTHDPLLAKQALCQLSYIPVLTCGFASRHAPCTVAQHSNSTITAAQDWMAWALWVAVVSAQSAASDRGCIRARALRLRALPSSDDYESSVERGAKAKC